MNWHRSLSSTESRESPVPLFAFAAGFFYFRSDDGSWSTYRRKLAQRTRTVLFPYFIIASIATTAWLLVSRLEGKAIDLTVGQLLSTWLLRPPAEQLWFLRDLMLLIVLAPVIRWLCHHRTGRPALLATTTVCWMMNWQPFPAVASWHALHMETLLFFVLGCVAVTHCDWLERLCHPRRIVIAAATTLWMLLIAVRVTLRADFDIWYIADYGLPDLLIHQASVAVGCVTILMLASQLRYPWVIHLSGASFFVYLVHEFPLRAVVLRLSERWLDRSTSCWYVTPVVLLVCFGAALILSQWCPRFVGLLTGGRTPASANRISRLSKSSVPVASVS